MELITGSKSSGVFDYGYLVKITSSLSSFIHSCVCVCVCVFPPPSAGGQRASHKYSTTELFP